MIQKPCANIGEVKELKLKDNFVYLECRNTGYIET